MDDNIIPEGRINKLSVEGNGVYSYEVEDITGEGTIIVQLTPKQRDFLHLFYDRNSPTYSNAFQSYMEAYNKEYGNRKHENTARVNACKFLKEKKALLYARHMKKGLILTDEIADEELAWVALQDENLSAKINAIKHNNEMKGRLAAKKVDLTSGNKPITGFNIVSASTEEE